MKRPVSDRVIRRISFYYEALLKLKLEPEAFISSKKMEEITGVSCNQVRQDFFYLGIAIGRQKKGYQVGRLLIELRRVLSVDLCARVVIVGAGRLGRALAEYPLFWARNIQVAALFDNNTELVGQRIEVNGQEIPILHVDAMADFFKSQPCIMIALLTVPEKVAQTTLERLVELGVKGVVNFAPRILKLPKQAKHVYLINECIGASLYKIVYQIFQTPST